ncbi:MAG: hypothetical protein R3300_17415 [Candidatus Promineifilaceae bacterium]|nr:hypothetical protein [Candidatus Promineifilaceae bacterium]
MNRHSRPGRQQRQRPQSSPLTRREQLPTGQATALHATQANVQQLQSLLGNRAVGQLIQGKLQTPRAVAVRHPSLTAVQREPDPAKEGKGSRLRQGLESETGDAIRGIPSLAADYMGTGTVGPTVTAVEQGSAYQAPQGFEGFHMGGAAPDTATPIVGGGLGMFMNTINIAQHGPAMVSSLKEGGRLAGQMGAHHKRIAQGEEELFAATKILEEKYQETNVKFVDSFIGLTSGINGVINGLTTILSAALDAGAALTAAMAAAVTFAVGAGLSAITGTISAIRDFVAVHKKRKQKSAVSAMIAVYDQALKRHQKRAAKLQARVKYPDTDPNKFYKDLMELTEVTDTIKNTEMTLQGLKVAERKQGFKTKLFSGGVGLTSAAGGAALLAATLGAVAATPVGWALAATAALVTLGLVIGMKVKRNIRQDNVERMRQELELIEKAKAEGEVTDKDYWHRSIFEDMGLKKKGPLRRAFTRSKKSGKIKVGERKAQLEAYLAKYDTQAAGEHVWEGFKRTLTTKEGDVKVDNPAYKSEKKTPGVPKKITLREQLEAFIQHQTGDLEKFKKSMFHPAQEDSAKELLLGKLNLSYEKSSKEAEMMSDYDEEDSDSYLSELEEEDESSDYPY